MSDSPLTHAHRLLTQAIDTLAAAAGAGAGDDELLSALTLCEGTVRRLDRVTVSALADLERRGVFAERGYRSSVTALGDLLGWERCDARRKLVAAEQVRPRIGLDGTVLPPRLPATAAVFENGAASLRHVEVMARVLIGPAAGRLEPQVWADAEALIAGWIPDCTPHEVHTRAVQFIDTLDADGPEPDDRPEPQVNELYLHRNPDGTGGSLKGSYTDAAMFDAIATLIDTTAKPLTADDNRTTAQRQAEALADACGYVLDHGTSTQVPDSGGRRPHLNILVQLDDLERCGRPPSWTEIHHIIHWCDQGPTSVANCVMLCKACHRLIHHAGWDVRLVNGLPEFYPPSWIDIDRRPRRRPPPVVPAAA